MVSSKLEEVRDKGKLRILDVGGCDGRLGRYLKKDDFEYILLDNEWESLKRAKILGAKIIMADGSNIPSRDNAFDVALSIASLEHILPENRRVFLEELKRVSSKGVLLHCPFGEEGMAASRGISGFINKLGIKNRWLEDNVTFGLPGIEELKDAFPGAEVTEEFSIPVWRWIVTIEMLPVLNTFLPHLVYLFLRPFDNRRPFFCCTVYWEKR